MLSSSGNYSEHTVKSVIESSPKLSDEGVDSVGASVI